MFGSLESLLLSLSFYDLLAEYIWASFNESPFRVGFVVGGGTFEFVCADYGLLRTLLALGLSTGLSINSRRTF